MEAQDPNPSEAPDEDDHMSGVVPTGSVANSGPEVDVRLRRTVIVRAFADMKIEQR